MNLETIERVPTERRMKRARIKVEVSPGMFSSERFIRFQAGGQTYQSIVDETDVENGLLRVSVIALNDQDALVELPRDTLAHGSRIQIPRALLHWG